MAKTKSKRAQQAVMVPVDWLEERSGLVGGLKYFLFRKVPAETNWFHTLGSATLTAFLVQTVTGVILAMYYKPAPAEAYESIRNITNDLTLGWLDAKGAKVLQVIGMRTVFSKYQFDATAAANF